MKPLLTKSLLVITSLLLSSAALAHKRWILPNDFTLSDAETVVADYSASNNIFYFDKAMPLDEVKLIAPSGEVKRMDYRFMSYRRGMMAFDIDEQGTYRIADVGGVSYFLWYKLPGQEAPIKDRGELQRLKAAIPANATDVYLTKGTSRVETFITLGAPSELKPSGVGLEVDFITHPNEFYSDEPSELKLLMDGKPAKGIKIVAVGEGTRYRDSQAEVIVTTDEQGMATFNWPMAGRYHLEAKIDEMVEGFDYNNLYHGYSLTFEVQAP
ncbi:DUF4198 domain-containing protein [Catenovulum sp. SM1970]|uniref:DUF4198 domain-containing protein n=1 Tax=Marinifaba aquimaris TaxID=2741323 RepID=UPI001573EC42|nr:DUF4198 domain-containing protein [Marinifaba aquimaris]NTS78646.1 DUF4198 domain-containing protein [Marinifaba aquimaris]